MVDEERQVFFALGKGGNGNFDHGEAVVEVLAEKAVGDGLAQVAVGCGDDADVDFAGLERANALNFLVLEGAQQLGLGGDGHVADFIEKQRTVAGGFEEARLVAIRAGEGAANVAEELALEECFDDGGAIEDDVLAFDSAARMQSAGDQIFAGASGSLDEGRAVVGGDAADAREHLRHFWTCANQAFELGVGAELLAAAGVFDEPADAFTEDGQADGLLEIIGCSVTNGLDGGFGGVVRGHQHDVGGGGGFHNAVEDVEAGHLGHDQVGQHQLRMVEAHQFQSLTWAGGGVDRQSLLSERGREQVETARVVVQNEDGNVHRTGYRVQGTGNRSGSVRKRSAFARSAKVRSARRR